MTQRVVVRLIDDLSGAVIPAGKGETVAFGLDGRSYEIDLTAKNARMEVVPDLVDSEVAVPHLMPAGW